MEIKNPELKEVVDRFVQQKWDGIDPSLIEIVALMDAFGGAFRFKYSEPMPEDGTWRPTSAVHQEIVSLLLAPENRPRLRQWYSEFRGSPMNPTAEALRDALSDMAGEELK